MSAKKKTKAKISGLGIEVDNITYKEPGNNLPKFVREAAAERGYGDATQPLSLFVNADDVAEAFSCAAQGNGSACVMAQAGTRIGAKSVYFYRTTAWVDFGDGPIVRYQTSRAIYNNVIAPFDEGDRDRVKPGIYHLTPFSASMNLAGRRAKHEKQKASGGKPTPSPDRAVINRGVQSHTERVVMASRVA